MNRYAVLLDDESPTAKIVEANEREGMLDFCYRNIGCSYIEIVHPEELESPLLLIVDEEGTFVEKPKMNIIASTWYGTAKHHVPIVGKALVMKEVMTNEGPDVGFLSEIEAEKIIHSPIQIPLSLLLLGGTAR